MRDWREKLAVVGEEVVDRRKSGASRMRRALEFVLATLEMTSVIVDLMWSKSLLVRYLMLYEFVGLMLVTGGEASLEVIGNSVLTEAGIRGGRDVRTDPEVGGPNSSCGIATDFENSLVKPSIKMK